MPSAIEELRAALAGKTLTLDDDEPEPAASENERLHAAYTHPEDSYTVSVIGATRTRYTVHPLALAMPLMSEQEFMELADDAEAHGVKVPLQVTGTQVIDGRHRLIIASVLDLPVRVEEFTGTEDQARFHIISLNVVRRHLTDAQRTLIARDLFLPDAEAEAKTRLEEGRRRGGAEHALAPTGAQANRAPKASQIAAERSHSLASSRSIERLASVDDAPHTQERIRRGEIKTVARAEREGQKETGTMTRNVERKLGQVTTKAARKARNKALRGHLDDVPTCPGCAERDAEIARLRKLISDHGIEEQP